MNVPGKIRRLCLERAGWRCERCGLPVLSIGWSLQHRIARGMGGTRGRWVSWPSNLAVLCGSATTGCHALAESRDRALHGWWLRRYENPLAVPVMLFDGRRVLLDDEGRYLELAA